MALVVIAEKGDLVIKVREPDNTIVNPGLVKPIKQTVSFRVSRDVMIKSTPYFMAMFRSEMYKEGNQNEITLEGDTVTSMEAWFRTLHGVKPIYDTDLSGVWRIIKACDKYNFTISKLNGWFEQWYDRQPTEQWLANWSSTREVVKKNKDPRSLLFPTWRFDYAKGFMELTKFLVYNCGFHITESNPIRQWDLHLSSRIIQQLNAARGRLKTIVFRPLYAPIKKLLESKCLCSDPLSCNYQRALLATGSWPIEEAGNQKSIRELLDKLASFRFSPPEKACMTCRCIDYEKVVRVVISNTRTYFDGLCLDCMNSSKAKTASSDTDYWLHNDLLEDEFVTGCRVGHHKQPSWYFSFMGRREEQDRFRKEAYEKRRQDL